MMTKEIILRSEMFHVSHLNPKDNKDREDIDAFRVDAPEGQGLSYYLKECVCIEEKERNMRTYLVRDNETEECVGYFALNAGLISLNETEILMSDMETGKNHYEREFDTLPGVGLAYFAVNSNYINRYPYQKGVGHVIFT